MWDSCGGRCAFPYNVLLRKNTCFTVNLWWVQIRVWDQKYSNIKWSLSLQAYESWQHILCHWKILEIYNSDHTFSKFPMIKDVLCGTHVVVDVHFPTMFYSEKTHASQWIYDGFKLGFETKNTPISSDPLHYKHMSLINTSFVIGNFGNLW